MNQRAVDIVHVIGPATGHLYAGYDTGTTWNGSPVVGFTQAQLQTFIEQGDGLDANGYGLIEHPDRGLLDQVSPTEADPIPSLSIEDLDGQHVHVYAPAGRIWDLHDGDPAPSLYNADLECTACGAHLANPHAPSCPTTEARAQHDLGPLPWEPGPTNHDQHLANPASTVELS